MRTRLLVVIGLACISASLIGVYAALCQDKPERFDRPRQLSLFTQKQPGNPDQGRQANVGKLTKEQIKTAIQKWWNDPSSPLVITNVRTEDQLPPHKYLVKMGDFDWQPLDKWLGPPTPSPETIAVPATYKTGPVAITLLFVIDRGSVIDVAKDYKQVR